MSTEDYTRIHELMQYSSPPKEDSMATPLVTDALWEIVEPLLPPPSRGVIDTPVGSRSRTERR